MSVKNQHFIPQVYLKHWNVNGAEQVYCYKKGNLSEAVPKNISKILCQSHTYTIGYDDCFFIDFLPEAKKDFSNQLERILREYSAVAYFDGKEIKDFYTSNSFVFSRGGVCLLCSFFAASSCARMDGFFVFAARDFLAFGAFSSALTAAARSVREICSPAFALASNSPKEGALFSTLSIIFSFCSVESSAVRSGFSRKNSGTCWKPTLSQ